MTHFISYDLDRFPSPIHQVLSPPATSKPVVLVTQGTLVRVEKSRTPQLQPTPALRPVSIAFAAYCTTLPTLKQQLITHAHQQETPADLANCLSVGTPLYRCTDGGALKHVGSIGWVIASTKDEALWDCTGSVFGWHANYF
jgi:hypothetical protein